MRKSTKEKFIRTSNKIHNNKYDYSKVIYINNYTKTCIICHKHGEFQQSPNKHLSGKGCSKCRSEKLSKLFRSSKKTFIKKAKAIHGERYDYSDVKYINSQIKVKIKCLKHDFIFYQTPGNHLSGQNCPKCNFSRGEELIEKILFKNNIKFVREFKLPHYKFRYDFYLPDHNLLIEFHGRQHYEPVEVFGGIEEFKRISERDAFKRSLAHDYKIPLLEFNYKQLKELSNEKFVRLVLTLVSKYEKNK